VPGAGRFALVFLRGYLELCNPAHSVVQFRITGEGAKGGWMRAPMATRIRASDAREVQWLMRKQRGWEGWMAEPPKN